MPVVHSHQSHVPAKVVSHHAELWHKVLLVACFNWCMCRRVFLHATASCGLGTDLPGISAVVIHDSDWDPSEDLQARLPCLV